MTEGARAEPKGDHLNNLVERRVLVAIRNKTTANRQKLVLGVIELAERVESKGYRKYRFQRDGVHGPWVW